MSKRIFTKEERETLLNNPYVFKCSDKSITFTTEFKIYAVHANREGRKPQDIFITANIPLDLVGRKTPKNCLRCWLKKDVKLLGQDNRGKHGKKSGRKRKERLDTSKMTAKEKIRYLETRIAYIDAENDFLAKARGIKRVPFKYHPGGNTN